jgi:16S rRNA (guanine(966)-N(2))-methyltransferase RsmD
MRISGGTLGGRTVRLPPGIIRPSMDRMRESIFAALGDLTETSFLDLFSGSGIIALEAASRGAVYIEAVETDLLKRKILIANAAISPIHIFCRFMPAELYIQRAKRSFTTIFCDPPFSYKYKLQLLLSIESSPLMTSSSLLLIHRPKTEGLDRHIRSREIFHIKETRYYGNSAVDFMYKKN